MANNTNTNFNQYNSDNNSDDEYSDSDSDDEILIPLYDHDETCKTRFCIAFCELYNKKRHGNDSNSNSNLNSYVTLLRAKYYPNYNFDNLYICADAYNKMYKLNCKLLTPHSYIRNYKNIINSSNINYIKPEIAECIVLPSGLRVSIIKTIWLRLIQRKWKRIYRERQEFIRKICRYSALKEREYTGRWPANLLSS